MHVIVGLGNPGAEYAQTRHNVGFMLVDAYARERGLIADWHSDHEALIAKTRVNGKAALLVKPQTFMNDSGRAVAAVLNWYKEPLSSLIVAHDDMDLPVGHVRIRPGGSGGGHRGIASIIACVGGSKFARVRIGIGHPAHSGEVVSHVLSPFADDERAEIDKAVAYLVPALSSLVADGVELAMSRYNPKRVQPPRQACAVAANLSDDKQESPSQP